MLTFTERADIDSSQKIDYHFYGVNVVKLTFLVLPLLILGGCTTSVTPIPVPPAITSTINEKSYELGLESIAQIGDPLIIRKSYQAVVETGYVKPSNAFSLIGGMGTVAVAESGRVDDNYRIHGVTEDGHRAVEIPSSHLSFGLEESGHWDGTIGSIGNTFFNAPVGSGGGYKLEPSTTVFEPVSLSTSLASANYKNHSIVFVGIGGGGIHFSFEEIPPGASGAPSTQQLIIPADTEIVKLKGYSIRLIRVEPTQLTYIVVED